MIAFFRLAAASGAGLIGTTLLMAQAPPASPPRVPGPPPVMAPSMPAPRSAPSVQPPMPSGAPAEPPGANIPPPREFTPAGGMTPNRTK